MAHSLQVGMIYRSAEQLVRPHGTLGGIRRAMAAIGQKQHLRRSAMNLQALDRESRDAFRCAARKARLCRRAFFKRR